MKRRNRPRDEAKELADQARLAKAWRAFHVEELNEALAGEHGAQVAEMMTILDQIELISAVTLYAGVERLDWNTVDYKTRLVVLHQINATVTRLRERQGLPPIDDPLPGQTDNLFRLIKRVLFPNS